MMDEISKLRFGILETNVRQTFDLVVVGNNTRSGAE